MNHESDHTVDAAKKELNAGLLELFKRCSYLYNEAFYANTELAILRELAISIFSDRPNFDRLNPIVHPLAEDEERFYPKEVESQRSYEKLFGDHYEMVTVCITTHDLSNLWKKRLNGLSKLTDMLRDQRNKVFAHNDIEALNYDELVRRLPLTFSEIQKLIDFALDLTIELFAKITGIEKDRLPKNYNDIQGLLKYAEVGMEAVEQHLVNLKDSSACK